MASAGRGRYIYIEAKRSNARPPGLQCVIQLLQGELFSGCRNESNANDCDNDEGSHGITSAEIHVFSVANLLRCLRVR